MLAMNSSNAFATAIQCNANTIQNQHSFSRLCNTGFPVMERCDLQIRTGVAWATFPTSSSACMIFLILATGNLHCVERLTILLNATSSARWGKKGVECGCENPMRRMVGGKVESVHSRLDRVPGCSCLALAVRNSIGRKIRALKHASARRTTLIRSICLLAH